ncbi:MFS general substrate transporter [Fomitiporia mediterranea MF3/22]|uniref:MFS general substrate transporter n=1 Tax=Fomitiporia mediterranea (strain MF3/22) TaxID=694068 RepID=UPI0004409103|nr:MFS general substrate transporter [Fomitiporia mediterranea MF3/22]EJD06330.1 MFS general substrate transporter [Fomitiporia mediterranea MF3/22]
MSTQEKADAISRETESDTPSKHQLVESPGVRRIEAISNAFNYPLKLALFLGIFLLSYIYGLDGSVRYTFQTTATNSYSTLPLLSTVGTVRSIIAAAAQPAYGRIGDVFGRVELLCVSVLFYVIGTIVEAVADNVHEFAGGAILYQLGMTGVQLLVEIIIADVTSLRNRLFLSYIPATPYLINAWVSGNLASSILVRSTWRWGVGMFAILLPALALPVIIVLMLAAHRAKRQSKLIGLQTLKQVHGSYGALLEDLFWRVDIVGLILICAFLSLILLPMTIAGGESSRWGHADMIAMFIIGFLTIPLFVFWEAKFARFPVMPFHLLTDRSIIGALLCAVFLNTVWYLQGDYLFTVLQVSFDQTVLSSTRIAFLYSFVSVITGLVVGIVVRYIRYIKWFAVTGVLIFTLGMGMLVRFRGTGGSGETSGMIGSQIVLGIAGGFTPYTVQALVQAATKHEHVALVTALYLSAYNVGSAIGAAISGAIWTNTLPGKLNFYLGNSTLATEAYGAPLTFIVSHPFGTPERTQMVKAYNDAQRLLCITGVCLCVPFLLCALVLRNPRLGDRQSLEEAENDVVVGEIQSGSNLKA